MKKFKILFSMILVVCLGLSAQAQELGSTEAARKRTLEMQYPTVRINPQGLGVSTGFVFASSEDGTYVLTNYHLLVRKNAEGIYDPHEQVDQFPPIAVKLHKVGGTTIERGDTHALLGSAKVMAHDPDKDLAVLYLETLKSYPYVAALAPHNIEVERNIYAWIAAATLNFPVTISPRGFLSSSQSICIKENSCITMLISQISGYDGTSGSPLFLYSPERKRYEVFGVVRAIGRDPYTAVLVDQGGGQFVIRPGFPVMHLTASISIYDIYDFFEEKGLMHLISQE